ncbi:MAG: hypothetical protein RLZZ598_1569 [Pseudomonadota bacterium]|jgi:uncharacterized protein
MKFQPERVAPHLNLISYYGPDGLRIGEREWRRSVLLPWQGAVIDWAPVSFEALEAAHFEQIMALKPELVLFGSGSRMRFARPLLMRSLIERGIGIETMDSRTACRTFNVLVTEGRPVVAALVMESA